MQSLNGRYYTACDVGTYSEDMDHVARECDFVTGRTVAHGGAGDSSVLTAYGVFQGMRAAAEVVWGEPTLAGRTVGVAGVGKVGRHLVRHLVDDGATVVVTDPHQPSVDRVLAELPQVRVVADTAALVASELDVYAPCALGGALTDEVVETLSARIVCGAANNQLAHPGIEKVLEEHGILYAPDYCVNSGGLIQVADELEGFSFERAQQRASGIFETTRAVFELASREQVPPAVAADRLAEQPMAATPVCQRSQVATTSLELRRAHHRQHPLLGLGDHHLEGLEVGLAQRDAAPRRCRSRRPLGGHLARRGGQTGGSQVLQREQQVALEQLQAALEQLRLLERVADLDARPLRIVPASSSAEASTEAPPIPSRPVDAPMITSRLPGPAAADRIISSVRARPTHIALTRQLCS